MNRVASAVLTAIFAMYGCGGNAQKLLPSIADCGTGTSVVEGKFVAPNGTTPVAGGEITISTVPG